MCHHDQQSKIFFKKELTRGQSHLLKTFCLFTYYIPAALRLSTRWASGFLSLCFLRQDLSTVCLLAVAGLEFRDLPVSVVLVLGLTALPRPASFILTVGIELLHLIGS